MKISVYIATSLDGFIAREDGALDWLPGTDGTEAGLEKPDGSREDYGYQALMDSVDVLVMGRHSYEMVLSFGDWPYGDKRVVVLSHQAIPIPPTIADTVSASSASPQEVVTQLQQEGLQHIYVDGGKTIQGFLRAGLIQELIITRIPVLIGQGIPLFGPLVQDIKLEHLNTQAYANGLVQSHYRVVSR